MEVTMSALVHRRLSAAQLNDLIDSAPTELVVLNDDHRRSLTARFRAVATGEHRRLDAFGVERANQPQSPFRWSPTTARRVVGNASLRRAMTQRDSTITECVRYEIDDQLLRAASGYARGGSLGHWLSSLSLPVLGLVTSEAVGWATQLYLTAEGLSITTNVPASDAYYDVAGARTTLRGRRDLLVKNGGSRIIVRQRYGAPGKSAGPGLRADLTIDALANFDGVAPSRIIGLWPEAGVMLSVDGTMADLRAGARDLVRSAVVVQRTRLAQAA
jgi:hypothetical protein